MRVAIAAGGTGGHIDPALAVARSLRARPAAPSCLDRRAARPRGRARPAVRDPAPAGCGALAAQQRARRPPRPGPAAPCRSVPQAPGPAPSATGRRLHDGRLRGHPGARRGLRSCASRSCCGRQRRPGRSVRATARLAGAIAVTDPRTCAALPPAAATRPGPRSATRARSTARRRATELGIPGRRSAPAGVRRIAGGAALQRGRGRGAARPRRALHGPPCDRRRRLRGGPRGPRRPAGGAPGRATGRSRSCADEMTAGPRRGRPGRRPRRRLDARRVRAPSACRSSASRTPTPRATSAPTRRPTPRPAPLASSTTPTSTRPPCSPPAASSTIPPPTSP